METKLNITEFQGKEVSQVLKTLKQLISGKKSDSCAFGLYEEDGFIVITEGYWYLKVCPIDDIYCIVIYSEAVEGVYPPEIMTYKEFIASVDKLMIQSISY